MKCEEVMDDMQRHLDGDLPSGELKRLNEHLETCPECAEMMERLVRIDQDLASLPKVAPPFSIVDSILPRLQQIDAGAQEATPTSETAPDEARPQRPWYARGAFAKYGGLAAAAAVLGVLIVNGLTDSFGSGSSSTANDTAASGGAVSIASKSETSSAQETQPMSMSAAESAADAPARSTEAPAPAPSAQAPQAAEGESLGTGGAGIMAVPTSPAEESAAGGGANPEAGSPAAEVQENMLFTAEESPERYEMRQGFTADGVDQDGRMSKEQSVPALLSDDGVYSATLSQLQDGTVAVVVDRLDGEGDYVSANRWATDAATVELVGWNGDEVTYTVTNGEGTRTFAIDAATGTETEIE